MGLNSVFAKSIVDHLIERYRKICASDLEACRQALAEPIEVDHLINVYPKWVEDSIQLAQDWKNPLTLSQILQMEFHAINKTGSKKGEIDYNWTIYKQVFMVKYYDLVEETKVTSRDLGFHSPNMMQEL